MMNVVGAASSECSSGCESGWTLYLEHSTSNFSAGYKKSGFDKTHLPKMEGFQNQDLKNVFYEEDDGEEEEEDLSMVSDASSGPPHFDHDIDEDDEEEDNLFCPYNNNNNNNNGGRLRKQSSRSYVQTQCYSNMREDLTALDDSASSAVYSSKRNGGIHVGNNGPSFERLIDYSSHGYSTTHFQGRSSDLKEPYGGCVHSPYSSAKRFHQHNQLS